MQSPLGLSGTILALKLYLLQQLAYPNIMVHGLIKLKIKILGRYIVLHRKPIIDTHKTLSDTLV